MPVQVVLPSTEVAIGIGLLQFAMVLGSAVAVSVAQALLMNRLEAGLWSAGFRFDARSVLSTGATTLEHSLAGQELEAFIIAYNGAVVSTYYLATAVAAATIIGALGAESLSVKKEKKKGNGESVENGRSE